MARHDPAAGPVALYRHFDADGRLLYVGASADPARRFGIHLTTSHWARQVSSISLEWFDTRGEAQVAEARAIRREWPLHNLQHSPRPRSKQPKAIAAPLLVEWLERNSESIREFAGRAGISVASLRPALGGA